MHQRKTVADPCQAVVKGGTSLGVLLAVMVCTASAAADVCTVPSASHPTIQVAVDDAYCTEIVLAAQTFVESVTVARDLTLRGTSSTSTVIEGRVVVEGRTTQVTIQDLLVDASGLGFTDALVAHDGAQVSGDDLVVVNGLVGSTVFNNGFESGDTTEWSRSVP